MLTVLMTWPTVLHLIDGIPGDGFDGWQNYWNLWWVKESLLVQGSTPYFTDMLYAPTGVSLLFHTLNIFNGLWTLPLQLNFGLAVAYNSVVFASFVLAGYGGYLLSLYTLTCLKFSTRHGLRSAAFVGGLVFTMSPFHLAHLLGHMQVFSMIWPPFYLLWLIRTLQIFEPSQPSPVYKNVILSTLFLILATLVDWYHTLYLLIFTGLALAWTILNGGQTASLSRATPTLPSPSKGEGSFLPSPLKGSGVGVIPDGGDATKPAKSLLLVLAIGFIFAVVLSPLLIPMVKDAQHRPDLQMGLDQNVTLSADLLAFVTPSEMHPLWGAWAKTKADNFSTTTSERLIFAGFVPLLLSCFVIISRRRNNIVKFWTWVVTTFFVLALGPYLHIGGKIVTIGSWPIPLPYLLLYHTVPFIGLTRSLSRYDLLVMLGLGVLSAIAIVEIRFLIGSKILYPRMGENPKSKILYVLLLSLIIFEFLPIPYPISKIDTPQFFYELANDSADYTIAELPMNWDRPTPLLHQTVHHKRLLTAYTSRNNPLELAWRTPVFQQWRYLSSDIIDPPLAVIAPTIFYDFNLRYIVLDFWQMPPGPERDSTVQWVKSAQATPIYHDDRLQVYSSPPKTETQPYLSLGNGWGERNETAGLSRSVSVSMMAELFLHHPQKLPLTLTITANSQSTQTMTLFADDKLLDTFQVEPIFTPHTVTLPPLTADLVKLQLKATETISVYRLSLTFGAN